MSKSQRDKGKRIERIVARELAPLWPGIYRSANQAGGALQPDLDGAPAWVEVSGGKAPRLWKKLRQARDDREASLDGLPIMVALRRDRDETVVCLPVSDFVALVQEERAEAVRVALEAVSDKSEDDI
jgi:hypothetical protein